MTEHFPPPHHPPHARGDEIIATTRHWLTRAVIGLNLCPFAKSVHVKGQVRYAVVPGADTSDLLEALEHELRFLADTDPSGTDTTLVILPDALADFHDYNDFLYFADRLLTDLRLSGTLQIASFHPDYQFDGTGPDDIENHTNRGPYPILHLIREASIERAVQAFPDAADIYERNQATMRRLGHEGLARWMAGESDERGDEPGDDGQGGA
jgi:hypothetical protein